MNAHPNNPKWWHGMKAVICDFCGLAQPTDSETSMAYDVSIFATDGFEAESEEEKSIAIDIVAELRQTVARQAATIGEYQEALRIATAPNTLKATPHKFDAPRIVIDHEQWEWNAPAITGREMRDLAGIPNTAQIFQKFEGAPDRELLDDINVDVSSGRERFSTQAIGSFAGDAI